MRFVVREETPADVASIRRVNTAAFETDAEAKLVDSLRRGSGLVLSLVADAEGEIVGHIAFSPVTLTAARQTIAGIGLGPMAVTPLHQRKGIGATLIAEGLERLRRAGHRFCVVLGHAEYYPRHGFIRASAFGIRWEKPVPDEFFFVHELASGALSGVSGSVRYRPEFDDV